MKKFVFLTGMLWLFCGCTHPVTVSSQADGNGKVIPLAELAMPGKLEQFTAGQGQVIFSADLGFDGEMPAPLDIMMELLQKQNPVKGKFTVTAAGNSGIVSRWNRYAAEAIFAGKKFDRKSERKEFLQKHFGNAAACMTEYFRILERECIANGTLCGFGYPSYPNAVMICENDIFDKLERQLTAAAAQADSGAARQIVAAEQKLLAQYRRKLTEKNAAAKRKAVANSGKVTEFVSLFGDKADIRTTLRLDADNQHMILTLTAEEPFPDRRRSQPRPRDFANMWADDGFEIFIIPDPDDPGYCLQFIVNSHGSIWDAVCDKHGLRHDKWNAAGAKVKVTELDGARQLEITIPWSDLGSKGIPGKPFLANVYRNRIVKGIPSKSCAWSPISSGTYYQPKYFGHFIWKEEK